MLDIEPIKERLAAASPGPWRSMRDGNQYIETGRITPVLVGASRVDGLVRPWNPYSFFGGIKLHAEFEKARFKDADADFIAAAPSDIAALVAEVERLRALQPLT